MQDLQQKMDNGNSFIPKNSINTIQIPSMTLRRNAGLPY